jgi:hypothetical protein
MPFSLKLAVRLSLRQGNSAQGRNVNAANRFLRSRLGIERGRCECPFPDPPEPSTQVRVTLERAINAFTAEFEEHAALNTQKKYRLPLAKLRTFGDGRAT